LSTRGIHFLPLSFKEIDEIIKSSLLRQNEIAELKVFWKKFYASFILWSDLDKKPAAA
jgi:hypothetical protein